MSSANLHRLDVALLTVNRQISEEAQEALFTFNTVANEYLYGALHHHDYASCKNIRYILLRQKYYDDNGILEPPYRDLSDAIKLAASNLPNLRSIVVSCRELACCTPVGALVECIPLCQDLRCIDLGIYEALPAENIQCKIRFENIHLLRLLPASKKLLSKGLVKVHEAWRPVSEAFGRTEEREEILLAIWLSYYEVVRESIYEPDAFAKRSIEEKKIMSDFIHRGHYERSEYRAFKHNPWPSDVRLAEITATGSSPELLEWATEYISMGISNLEDIGDYYLTRDVRRCGEE